MDWAAIQFYASNHQKSDFLKQSNCVLLLVDSDLRIILDGVWHDMLRFPTVKLMHINPKMLAWPKIS